MEQNTPEMKIRSIRAEESVLSKFTELSKDFVNQSECLSQLITVYEIANAKSVLVNLQMDIADYETHITAIQKAFIHILELNQNAEARAKAEFINQLESRDKIIIELQGKEEQHKKKINELLADNKTKSKDISRFVKENENLVKENERNEQALKDKQTIINELNARLLEQSEIEKEIKGLRETISEQNKTIKEQSQKIAQLVNSVKKSKQDLEYQQRIAEAEKKEVAAEIKAAYADEKESQQNKIANLQEEVFKLKEKLSKNNSGVGKRTK